MSEPKGPFDTSLTVLRYGIGDGEDFEAAIRVLEDWPKWKPLIEAAGNLHRGACLMFMDDIELPIPPRVLDYKKVGDGIRALLEALPEED
jgi:hypothetical protein